MYEDLDRFFENLSDTSKRDIILGYREALKGALGERYFIDPEARLFCALIRNGDKYMTLRLEGKDPRFTKSVFKKMRALLKEADLPVEAHTHKDFWNDNVKQLLRMLHFGAIERRGSYFVATYRGD